MFSLISNVKNTVFGVASNAGFPVENHFPGNPSRLPGRWPPVIPILGMTGDCLEKINEEAGNSLLQLEEYLFPVKPEAEAPFHGKNNQGGQDIYQKSRE